MAGIEIWLKTWLLGNAIASTWTWFDDLEMVFATLALSFLGSLWIILPINILVKWLRNKKPNNLVPVILMVHALLTNFSIVLSVAIITFSMTVGGFRLPWTYMMAFTVAGSIVVLKSKKLKTAPNKIQTA